MKIFFLKSFLLFSMVVFSCILITYYTLRSGTSYFAALIDKHQILKKTSSPKIILVGGSNVAFGIDSSLIKDTLGFNVVNMGLHAGFGLRYMISEIQDSISEGDIIIISPEFEHFFGSHFYGDEQLFYALMEYPKIYKYLCLKQYINIIKGVVKLFQREFRGLIDALYRKHISHFPPLKMELYSRDGFNKFGDEIDHLDKPTPEKLIQKINMISSFSSETKVTSFLNSFHKDMLKKKAKVFYIFPAIPESVYKKFESNFISFNIWLRESITIPIIGSPKQYMLPESYFFDSHYHLNRKGVDERTLKIITELSKAL